MGNISNKYLVAGVLFMLLNWVNPARAFFGVGDVVTDPGLTGQTIAAEAARAAQTLTMIQNQFNEYQMMARNTLALGDPIFTPVGNAIRSLNSMYMQGQSLMWRAQNIDQQFGMMNPGYASYLYSMGRGGPSMSNMYQKWSEQGNQSTRSALLGAGVQVESTASDQEMLNKLVVQSNTAGGQMQALQAANQIAANQAEQMLNLRALVAQQNTLQAEYMTLQNARMSASDAWQIQFRGNRPIISPAKGY